MAQPSGKSAPDNEEEESKVHEISSDKNAEANSFPRKTQRHQNGEEQYEEVRNILPPFSDKLKFDRGLQFRDKIKRQSPDDLKNIIEYFSEVLKPEANIDEHIFEAPFPTPSIMAKFASLAYKDYSPEKAESHYEKKLPKRWKLLTTAINRSRTNDYFGVAYWQPEHQLVVIAHRGTKLKEFGALFTDVMGVLFCNYVPRMNSACTFAFIIREAIEKVNVDCSANFRLFFTGHSLGGWLAQITTFCSEYMCLDQENEFFLLTTDKENEKEGVKRNDYHAHATVFESPGCKAMLLCLEGTFDVLYNGKSTSLETLDITSYLSAPNIVNTCNSHVGILYRIFTDLSKMSWKQKYFPISYTIATHSMKAIKNVFKIGDKSKVHVVVDWPINKLNNYNNEYMKIFKWVYHKNGYHYAEQSEEFQDEVRKNRGYFPIRYQTNKFNRNECSVKIFTQQEKDFLTIYQCLRENATFFKPEKILSLETSNVTGKLLYDKPNKKTSKLFLSLLQEYKINKTNIICLSTKNLNKLIPFIKRFLHFFPETIEAARNALTPFGINKKLYQSETETYLSELKMSVNFKINTVDISEFLNNTEQQAWNIKTEYFTRISVAKFFQQFQKIKNINEYPYTVLEISKLIELNSRFVSISEYLKSEKIGNHLLIVDGIQNTNLKDLVVKNILDSVLNILGETKTIKLILFTKESDNLTKMFQNKIDERQTNMLLATSEKDSLWITLETDSQKELLSKKMVCFQNKSQKISLENLINIEDGDDLNKLHSMIDTETTLKLENGEEILIGSDLSQIYDLHAAYSKIHEEISSEILKQEILNSSGEKNIYFIDCYCNSNADSNAEFIKRLELKGSDVESVESKLKDDIIILETEHDTTEMKFKKLCRGNSQKIIHWLKMTPDHFIWLQLYDDNFYCPRKFNYIRKIYLNKRIKEQMITPEIFEYFIVSDLLENQTLEKILDLDAQEIKQLSENLSKSKKIHLASSYEAGAAAFQKQHDKPVHWLRVEKNENIPNLVWHSSRGSLDTMRKYIDRYETVTLDETSFIENTTGNVVIFADVPGMGKSTSFASLARQIKSDWVIRINLRDCKEAIRSIPPKKLEISQAVEFLAKTDPNCLKSTLAKGLLEYALELREGRRPVGIYLLFDGFDEIKEDCVDKKIKINHEHEKKTHALADNITRLLQFFQRKTSAKIWITTRKYKKQHLENSLSVFSTTFKPFEQERQVEFLKAFWKVRLSLKLSHLTEYEETLSVYAQQIFTTEKKILKDSSMMGHPLVMRLLAEAVQPKPEFLAGDVTNNFGLKLHNIVELYQCFVEMKYEIYLKEKLEFSKSLTNMHKGCLTEFLTKKHRHLAFQRLFPNKAETFLGHKNGSLNDEETELNTVGLIQTTHGDKNFEFIHDSCAEYFVAGLITTWLMKPNGRHQQYPAVEEFLLTEISIKPEYEIVRLFLNEQFYANISSDTFATFYKEKIAQHYSKECKPDYKCEQKTALHVYAEENHTNIMKFLLTSCKQIPEVLIDLLCIRNDNGDSTLYVAAKGNRDEITTLLMERVRNCTLELKHKLLLATIFRRADDIDNDIIKKCSEAFVGLHHNPELGYIHGAVQEKWKSIEPFLEAARVGNMDTVRQYFHGARDDFANYYYASVTDKDKKTALHFASEHGHLEVVKFLLEQKANVNVKDRNVEGRDNLTPLHYAAKSGTKDIVKVLLDNGAAIDNLDRSGLTPLHHAIRAGKKDIVEMLEREKADVKIKSKNGMSALCWAAKNGNREIVNLLITQHKDKIDINGADKHGMTPFYHAAKNGHWDAVQCLADNGANVNNTPSQRKSPFEMAVHACKWDFVEKMLKWKVKVDPSNIDLFNKCKDEDLVDEVRKYAGS